MQRGPRSRPRSRSRSVVALGVVTLMVACGTPPEDTAGADDPPSEAASERDPAPAPTGPGPDTADPVVERPEVDITHLEALAQGIDDVGYRIFRSAADASAEDVVLSPLSIGLAFGMADAGASGPTAEALEELFDYPVSGEDRWTAFNALERSVTDVGPPTVRVANRQFPDESFDTVDGYDELLARWFGAGLEPLPLQRDPEGSRERVNGWVSERTRELIPDLLPEGFLGPNSVLVLVNALYLEADWDRPFGKYPTQDRPFTRRDGSTVTVPLMHELELRGPSVETDEYAATEIPYEGGALSMLVVVPNDGHYDEIEAGFDGRFVEEVDAATVEGATELYLPRFDSDSTLDLREALEGSLGVEDVFGVRGFEGIAPEVSLESAVHAADIAVDEEGTVAAAATGLSFQDSGPPEPDVTVRADRPFLYLIRHQPSGAVLFVGRVLDPAA